MAEQRGGQIVEIAHKVGEKEVGITFTDYIVTGEKETVGAMTVTKKPYSKWVIVKCEESMNMTEKFGAGLGSLLKKNM